MKKPALALCAVCLGLVAIVAARAIVSDVGGAESAGPVPTASRDNRIAITSPLTPKVDSVIDLSNGAMKPLPDSIIRTAGKPDEGRLVQLSPGRYAASRDGSQLAFVGRGEDRSQQIFIAGIDGTGVRQVTHDPQGATAPAWSPDASMIAYNRVGDDRFGRLVVLDVATGESSPLPGAGGVQTLGHQFRPDGSSILYTGGSWSYPVLRTVPIDGGKSTVFIGPDEGMADAGNGSLSPDGSLVTMMGSELGGPGAIRFVANADGTERLFIRGRTSNPAGTWSPDGRRIVCASRDRRSDSAVVVVDIATGRISPVARGSRAIWLDGHTLLVEAS